MSEKQLNLSIGAMSPKISVQLKSQGYNFNPEEVEHFQKDSDAITRVLVRGFVGSAAANKMRDKLAKKIVQHVKESNEVKDIIPA